MPIVSRLAVTPVKGLALHHPDELLLEECGVAENRRFFLVRADGRLFSGLQHGPLCRVRAEYDPRAGRLAVFFPDGGMVADEVRLGDPALTDFWGARVPGRLVVGPWSDALSSFAGRSVRLVRADRPGGGVDVEPVTLVSEASVEELGRRSGRADVDGRRFRMLATLAGCSPHEEDAWQGRRLRLGEAVVAVGGPVPRCATTTRDPDTGARDFDALRAIKGYRGLRAGKHVDFGVYARVERPGRVRVGDPAELV